MTGEIDIPVLIVGGGGAGLSASNILADLGVQSLLIERHPSTANLPKAHYLNQRTMEIFRHHGLANEVYAKAAPRANLGKMVWCTSFGGDGPLDRKTIAIVDALGGGELAGMYDLKGVTPPTNIPQIRLEPVLARTAAQRNPDGVLFEHELVSLHERDGHVDAKVLNRATGKELNVRAQYVIGADGGKTIGPMFGVQMIGPTNMRDLVTFYVKADFSDYITDDLSVMRVIMNPDEIGTAQYLGAALAYGPEHWDRRSEEWGIVWAYDLNDPQRHDKDSGVELIKRFLKVDVPIEIKRVSHWTLEVVVADRFRIGERVFLAGDAAHRQPPAAGLGMNSGIQDVHNLCWKLAYVLKGAAPAALLDSYEPERRPVIERNAEWANFSWMSNATLHSAMGFVNGAPKEYNRAVLEKLLSDTADGASRRAYMYEVLDTARVEFAVHDFEMGFTYARGAVVDDGRPFPPRDPMGHEYTPSTRPGCRLPHAWLRVGEQTLSTHDLLPHGGFLLLTGASGAAWCAAAARLAADLNIPIRAVRIGAGKECEASDPSGIWAGVCGISPNGAVLVRPDGHVAYRAEQGVASAAAGTLRTALENVLSSASLGR